MDFLPICSCCIMCFIISPSIVLCLSRIELPGYIDGAQRVSPAIKQGQDRKFWFDLLTVNEVLHDLTLGGTSRNTVGTYEYRRRTYPPGNVEFTRERNPNGGATFKGRWIDPDERDRWILEVDPREE